MAQGFHHRIRCAAITIAGAAWVAAMAAGAAVAGPTLAPGGDPGQLCRSAVSQAEAGSALPPHLLAGIARVESGRRDPATGRFGPWPWSINAEGRDEVFDTKAAAIAFAQRLQARGVRSFDVGCLQVNLMYHPDAFASLEQAFDPLANARYAVGFLTELRQQTGSWETASAWYHSATPEEGIPYRRAVVTAMAAEAASVEQGPVERASLSRSWPAPSWSAASWSGSASAALHSLPGRAGVILLRAGSGGAGMTFPGRGYAGLAAAAAATAPAAGAAAVAGRGLDAYRLRPVAMVAFRMAPPPRFP